jgi:hypothetical protein
MQTNSRLAFQLLAAFVVIVVAGLCLPLFSHVAVRGPQTKSLSNAKQLATACRLYAMDHEGRFPMHLNELEPDYIVAGQPDGLRDVSLGKEDDPKYMLDWLYFGAGFEEKNPPRVLIASPQATTTAKTQKRVVIEGDMSGTIWEEPKYQEMLAETVRQMRALDDARHLSKPAPSDAPSK